MFSQQFSEEEITKMTEKISSMPRNYNEKGCHLWTKSKTAAGYGRIYMTVTSLNGTKFNRYFPVHRMAIFLHLNAQPLDNDLHASHICHIKDCFNPHHISLEPCVINNARKHCKAVQNCIKHEHFPDCILY